MANSHLKTNFPMECKPKLLKDFLNDDSRNDFRQIGHTQQVVVLKRSKSRTAATSTILAIHKASEIVIKTLKFLPFATVNKFPFTLPRSISHKFSSLRKSKDNKDVNQREDKPGKVKVKDILRWRSSRDLVEEESTPLDLLYSPSRCTINTTTSGSTSCSSPLSSKSSSWCESDFSAEDFPSWCYASGDCFGENEMKMAYKSVSQGISENLSHIEYAKTYEFSPRKSVRKGISEKAMDEADEQYTPVSVLASPFEEDHGNNESEEKANKLLHLFKETTLLSSYDSYLEENLLMDYFWEELSRNEKDENDEVLERKLVESAQDWFRGVHKWSMQNNYVKEMEKGLKWNKHEEEKEEIGLQLEKIVFNSLVDEVLFGLITL